MYISNQAGFASSTWGSNPFLQVNSPKIGILEKNALAQLRSVGDSNRGFGVLCWDAGYVRTLQQPLLRN